MKLVLVLLIAVTAFASPSFAVDPTISPYCLGEAAKDHANFCAAVANNKSLADTQRFDDDAE